MIFSKTNLCCEGNMKKWKNNSRLNIVLAIMSVALIILLAPITMPLMFLGGVFGIWFLVFGISQSEIQVFSKEI